MTAPVQRPRTRSECLEEARPCPWVGCRHHIVLDVSKPPAARDRRRRPRALVLLSSPGAIARVGRRSGLRADGCDAEVDEFGDEAIRLLTTLEDTCSLDIAERGEHTDEELAELLNVTVQQVQREVRAAAARAREKGLAIGDG